jgi:hypothetical protein
MKSIVLSLIVLILAGGSVQAQKKVKERDLKGHWQMVFDFDEDFIKNELEDEPDIPWLGKIVAEGVSGFVLNILDEIDIEFEFQSNNRLKIMIDAFGEESVEFAHWHIDSKGALILDEEDQDDDIWLFDQGKLYAYEKNRGQLERQPIFLERVY